MYSYS